METIIIDYEHVVTDKIAAHTGDPGFPNITDYGITRKQLDDYLFDKQVILDSRGTEKSQYTVLGICIIIPVLILSAIPDQLVPGGGWSLLWGVGVGLVIALIVRLLTALFIKRRLCKIRDEKIECYIAEVLKY
uniref:hypothetical protein n=1 Tax=Hoylesella pleuritidis TaxID=407975 RepID=UPI0004693B04|nr:hypothetical protein [Hoylesella pleuritidis]